MKTKNLKWIVIPMILTLSLSFTSCKDDDGSSLDNYKVKMGTVENPEKNSLFFFTLDNTDRTRMWVGSTALPYFRPDDGQRIIASYTIISNAPEGSSYDHVVRLNDAYGILTKDIIEITEENEEKVGNDPVSILPADVWISNDYLNVEFNFLGYNLSHYINLGENTSQDYNDGKVHLEFRHNAYNDLPRFWKWGMASFRLEPLQQSGTRSLDLVIHYREYNEPEEQTIEIKYNYGEENLMGRSYTLEDAAEVM